MNDVAPSTGRPTLDKPRSRRDAAKVLGLALQARYRKLCDATGEDEIVMATVDLSQCMYENIEFVIWALKVQGGMKPPSPEQLRKITPLQQPANDPRFATPPPLVLNEPAVPDVCTCAPMEPGIIGGDRHMTSCPKYVP